MFLDSASVNGKTGRYSFLCIGEVERFSVKDVDDDAFYLLEEFFKACRERYSPEVDIPFGIFGFISYDANRYLERVSSPEIDDLNWPDMLFILPETTFIFDNVERRVWRVGRRVNLREKRGKFSFFSRLLGFNMEKDYFIHAVERIKDYIGEGDTFQVNFSQRIDVEYSGEPFLLYERLRRVNPSPFSFFLDFGGIKAVSCSPERLVKKDGRFVETRPIAGTRRRGRSAEEERRLERELFLSEKERAEHIMLVDLERNDLGRVCEYGTVEVDELMVKESYSHVIHIVSNVKGVLRENLDSTDVLRAVFPGGTITGAPKVRTMEIIAELEPTRRALYTGSVGYIGFNGSMDFNIVIRTFLFRENRGYLQVGAGIVWDSDPELEYRETLSKAEALLVASSLRI